VAIDAGAHDDGEIIFALRTVVNVVIATTMFE
jgi:hypothetical protein